MSRIYEALQKAEAERGLDREPLEAEYPHEDRSGLDLDLHRRPVAAEPFADSFSRGTQPAPSAAESFPTPLDPPVERARPAYVAAAHSMGDLSPRSGDVDLDAIPQTSWSPAFERLPALLERGPAVEQFRSLRSRIYEMRDKRPLKTILITSGLPQEGKSFVSTNLAVSLARNKNSRVLLIDGDMRRYTVHQVLGCNSEPGLADYLAGRARLTDVIQRCDPNTSKGITNGSAVSLPPLALIPGGNGGDKAADLSNNHRFEELIRTAAPLFDWIIVDSSPVLPVSDAVNLSRHCDGVLLVARSGVTEYENAQRTQAELKSAHLLGFVLNGASAPTDRGGYYGYSAVAGLREVEQSAR